MVAKIITGKSISGALNYNEHKVAKGKAELLLAACYPKDKEQLSFYDKLGVLQSLTSLNHRAHTNCIHISLNFDPSEKLTGEQLAQITESYMGKIGFGAQPYLVYQHHDAAHNHVHIVTTNIQKEGKRIELHNIGKFQSEKARKEIETEFNLIRAESRKQQEQHSLKPVMLEKASYGTSETKRAITNIVREVTRSYKFTSLTELNAVLRQFNVEADQGSEGTKMRETGGLRYAIIDQDGKAVGVPIKASDIYGKPTIKTLEEKFEQNRIARNEYKEALKETLADTLRGIKGADRNKFKQALKSNGINAVLHENAQGFIYGITYIDNVNRYVFKGSDLGKEFSAKALSEHLDLRPQIDKSQPQASKLEKIVPAKAERSIKENTPAYSTSHEEHSHSSYLPYELSRDKKKKKKKRRTL